MVEVRLCLHSGKRVWISQPNGAREWKGNQKWEGLTLEEQNWDQGGRGPQSAAHVGAKLEAQGSADGEAFPWLCLRYLQSKMLQ